MSLWRRGSLARNPYSRTAFRTARVPRETVRYRTVVQIVGQTKRIVSTDPTAHMIQGEPVTHAEINAAEKILLDSKQRIVEELLEHASEKPPLDRVRQLSRVVAEAMTEQAAPQLRVKDFSGLEPLRLSIIRQFLDTSASPDPSFGALELDIVPPFGREEED